MLTLGIPSGCSKIQLLWMEDIMRRESIVVQHALSPSGEYYIPGIGHVDGYCSSTNTVYEFHGDFWHGNPKLFKPDDINPISKKCYGELYQATLKRDALIKALGYTLVVAWESEIDKRLKVYYPELVGKYGKKNIRIASQPRAGSNAVETNEMRLGAGQLLQALKGMKEKQSKMEEIVTLKSKKEREILSTEDQLADTLNELNAKIGELNAKIGELNAKAKTAKAEAQRKLRHLKQECNELSSQQSSMTLEYTSLFRDMELSAHEHGTLERCKDVVVNNVKKSMPELLLDSSKGDVESFVHDTYTMVPEESKRDIKFRVKGSTLFKEYASWCERQKVEPLSSKFFGQKVKEVLGKPIRSNGSLYQGIIRKE